MAGNNRRAVTAVENLIATPDEISGRLGIQLNGVSVVDVPTRPGYVYVRLRDNTSELIQAFNDQVSAAYDLPVLVKFVNGRYVITGRDTARYASWGNPSSYVPAHANQHSLLRDSGGGGDPLYSDSRQLIMGAVYPSGSLGAMSVVVSGWAFRNTVGTWSYVGNTGTPDLSPIRPTGAFSRLALICLDYSTGGLIILTGSYFSVTITGAAQVVPFYPPTTLQQIPLAAVRISSGTSSLSWENIYDARQWIDSGFLTGSSGGGGGVSLSNNIPQPIAYTPSAGVGTLASRDDHVHAIMVSGTDKSIVYLLSGSLTNNPNFWIQDNGAVYFPNGVVIDNNINFNGGNAFNMVFHTTFGSPPTALADAQTYFDSTTRLLYVYDGAIASWDYFGKFVGPTINLQQDGVSVTGMVGTLNFISPPTAISVSGTIGRIPLNFREKLVSARTYYVRTDGNDTNTGLTNTSGGAFLTIQRGVDVASVLDNGGFDVTIQVIDGTYSSTNVTLKSAVGSGKIIIQGNSSTPSLVSVTCSSGNIFTATNVKTIYTIKDMKLSGTGSAVLAILATGSYIEITGVTFGTGFSTDHILTNDYGEVVFTGNYVIAGGTTNHWAVSGGVVRCQSRTVTITGSPAFSGAFLSVNRAGVAVVNGDTFSGSATGVRYSVTLNGVADTGGGGANYLPGNSAGSTASGGQYA